MIYVIGVLVAIFLVLLIVGAVTGRVKARHCCAPADADQDLRMTPRSRGVPDGAA